MDIRQAVQKEYAGLVSLRRQFHTYPELSEQEFHTMDTIEEELKKYGIPCVRVPHGGVVGIIDSGREGYTVLLRADIDALPIQESPDNLTGPKICISKNKGVSHACGHDGHTAMLLTEGKILAGYKNEWSGKVILMFEEGEENGSRCLMQIFAWLKEQNYHVDVCHATHVRWDIPAGKVAILPGPVMAGAFLYGIRIIGKGGHGSRPDLANNPLDCFTAFYRDIQMIRMKYISPDDCLTFSIGKITSGNRPNVIPDELYFEGTCRFFQEEAGQKFQEKFWHFLEQECQNYGCTYTKEKARGVKPVRNNRECADIAKAAVEKELGKDRLYQGQHWMASESMGITLEMFPGILSFTGIRDEKTGSGANHHTPEFDIGEEGLAAGAEEALAYTLEMLRLKPNIRFASVCVKQV